MTDNAPIDFGDVTKNADSVRQVVLEFFDNIADFWEPGIEYASSAFIRPREVTGFSYEATVPGQSKLREPRWPTTIAATISDGEIVWTARDAGSNGVNGLSTPVAAISPSGQLSASAVAIANGMANSSRLVMTLTGGNKGSCYNVSGTVVSGIQTLTYRFLVNVK